MNLNSTKDLLLLRNCILLQLKSLNINRKNSIKNKNIIDIYSKLLDTLNTGDIEKTKHLLNMSSEDFSTISNYIKKTPLKTIASDTINTFKKQLQEANLFSEKSFRQVEDAFYKGNEDLLKTKYFSEHEEEPEINNFYHLSKEIKENLSLLKTLINKTSKDISPDEFKLFCIQYKILVKDLGMKKFEQYFNEKNLDIISMQIYLNKSSATMPLYQIDFTLLNKENIETQFSVYESAKETIFILDYYQTLCYAYLEAEKSALLDNSEITKGFISEKITNFIECYKKLIDMAKYKINIASNNKVIFSSKSVLEPSELDFEACSNQLDVLLDT